MNGLNKKALSLLSIVLLSSILNIGYISAGISFNNIINNIKNISKNTINLAKENKAISITLAVGATCAIAYGISIYKNKSKKENISKENEIENLKEINEIFEKLYQMENNTDNNETKEEIIIETQNS